MSQHLSSEQIAGWAMGDRGIPEQEHVRDCAQCRSEVTRIEFVLGQFGSSARALGELAPARVDSYSASQRQRPAHRPGRLILAAAALLILATVPLYQNVRDRKRAVERAEADAILLERVDRAVSRTVPRTMEPLIDLVRWGSAPQEGNGKKQ